MTVKEASYSHFIAVPMSAIARDEYDQFRVLLAQFVDALEKGTGRKNFCAAIHGEGVNFDHPADAYNMDIDAVRAADEFIMIWPSLSPSGAIYEAGYAAALGKPVTIFVKDRAHLPFMLRYADEQSRDKIKITLYRDMSDILNYVVNK